MPCPPREVGPLPPIRPVRPRRAAWVGRVRDHIEAHLYERLPLVRLAAVAGVHPVQLSRGFRRGVGCTLTEYLRLRRVERACAMIRDSSLPLTRVALAVGFAEHAHFTRSFRRVTGMTPSAYRALAAPDPGA
ncbi:MAG TPA: AraC family transcriptional regulator [Gemmatimonadaceae bacterium]|nr:AraC family transcriptional regulator [Gemmatimonadaceae bacterium]